MTTSPPWGATPPDDSPGQFGFDFTRFGPRVPTVLVSPWIAAGTVHRVPDGTTPFDHTSVLATVEQRWGLSPLTQRDATAPGVGGALSLTAPRTDDPLADVTPPTPPPNPPDLVVQPSHLQQVQAAAIAERLGHSPERLEQLETGADYAAYIRENG